MVEITMNTSMNNTNTNTAAAKRRQPKFNLFQIAILLLTAICIVLIHSESELKNVVSLLSTTTTASICSERTSTLEENTSNTQTKASISDTATAATGATGVRFSGEQIRYYQRTNNNIYYSSNGLLLQSSLSSPGQHPQQHQNNNDNNTMGEERSNSALLFPLSVLPKKQHQQLHQRQEEEDVGKEQERDEFISSCKQWAVVTTINQPTKSILQMADFPRWCFVIVGDTKTPDEPYMELAKSKENLFYLSSDYQKKYLEHFNHYQHSASPIESSSLSSPSSSAASSPPLTSFFTMMPFKSFARKNVGYLFAIYHGAKVIYDFDDDNILTPFFSSGSEREEHDEDDDEIIPPPFLWNENVGLNRSMLLRYLPTPQQKQQAQMHEKSNNNNTDSNNNIPIKKQLPFNPYPYMGASHRYSWPRGFPIDQLQQNFAIQDSLTDLDNNNDNSPLEFGDLPYTSIGVIQSLCNGDPDNDAIFRMTRAQSTSFTFEREPTKSLPLAIPFGMYSPYNAQATTHLYASFWGLYLPITVPGRVTDIWRSYITQRIMQDVGLYLVYTPPIVTHDRSAHDYLSDFQAESNLYTKTTRLLEFLDRWTSSSETLPERILELWIALYERDYIELADVDAVREWLNILITMGYEFPKLVVSVDNGVASSSSSLRRSQSPSNHAITSVSADAAVVGGGVGDTGPRNQPHIEGQMFRAYPYFNIDRNGNTFAKFHQRDKEGYAAWWSNVDMDNRPSTSAVVKIILMTMNEWPLIKSWVQYHGEVLGFENLYIVDGSDDLRCVSYLRYARDILGVNVIFSKVNLQGITMVMSDIQEKISGSADFVIKMDTDEFLTAYDDDHDYKKARKYHDSNTTTSSSKQQQQQQQQLKPSKIAEYLFGFSKNESHPLRTTLLEMNHRLSIGFIQDALPSESFCKENRHALPDRLPLSGVEKAARKFKAVYDANLYFDDPITLGGHRFEKKKDNPSSSSSSSSSSSYSPRTKFGILHFHNRCFDSVVKSARQVLVRHGYIGNDDSDDVIKTTLARKLRCKMDDLCTDTCTLSTVKHFDSFHKALELVNWLHCPETITKEYYYNSNTMRNDDGKDRQTFFNDEFNHYLQLSAEKFHP